MGGTYGASEGVHLAGECLHLAPVLVGLRLGQPDGVSVALLLIGEVCKLSSDMIIRRWAGLLLLLFIEGIPIGKVDISIYN